MLLLATIGAAQDGVAQNADVDPPLTGRPKEYSHIAGRYRIVTQATPTEVFVEEPITLKVRIIGEGPERFRPDRRRLKIFPEEFADQFHIEPLPEKDQVFPRDNAWEFVYRLRPRSTEVESIPELRLVYYALSGKGGAYQTTESDPIKIRVKPKPPVLPKDVGLTVVQWPERLLELNTGDAVLARQHPRPLWTPTILSLLLLGPPLLGAIGLLLYRRWFPDRVRQVQERRSRAASRALRVLQTSTEPAHLVLATYLAQRLDFAGAEPTPVEIGQFLRRKGVAAPVRQQWSQFFSGADRLRFDPSSRPPAQWAQEAAQLIHALEADKCLAR